MVYFDLASFEVDGKLSRRLGYKKIYAAGKDVWIFERPDNRHVPQIVISKDPGVLFSALRSRDVKGIIFRDNEFAKRVAKKAAESGKTIFVPLAQLLEVSERERSSRAGRMRKIIMYAHKFKAPVRLVSLAEQPYQLLSAAQMAGLADFMFRKSDKQDLFGGDIL